MYNKYFFGEMLYIVPNKHLLSKSSIKFVFLKNLVVGIQYVSWWKQRKHK